MFPDRFLAMWRLSHGTRVKQNSLGLDLEMNEFREK